MRFNISSTALSSKLLTLSKVINSKNSLPILDCFLFEVHNGQLTITASDSENVMQTILPFDELRGRRQLCRQQPHHSRCRQGTARTAADHRCQL